MILHSLKCLPQEMADSSLNKMKYYYLNSRLIGLGGNLVYCIHNFLH